MTDTDPTPSVVVAVMGAVAPICQTVADFWNSLKQGRSGIGPVEGLELNNFKTQIAGQIKDFDHRVRLKHWQRDKTILFSAAFPGWLQRPPMRRSSTRAL